MSSNEKSLNNENQEIKKEESMVSLLYSFKRNITSQDPFYPLNNLLLYNNKYGWQSSRFCSYPQEIIIEFHSRVNIKQINILIHEKKIPSIIEFVNCFEQKINEQKYYREKKIGYIRLSSNEESNFKARELRKIHVNIFTKRLKLLLHKNYSNAYNIFCQVGLIYMNFLGYILPEEKKEKEEKLNYSELLLDENIDDIDENLIYEKMDDETKEKLKMLLEELEEKKKMENYEECRLIKNKIDQLKKISFKISNLENYKKQYLNVNNFDKSQQINNDINKLKQKLNNEFNINNINNMNNISNSAINKFNTINPDIVPNINNNIEEKIFTKKIKNQKMLKENKLKLSQSQPDLFNFSEQRYDDIVLPTIQKKMNSNVSTINNINNNSSNSFEINNNSNNTSGVFDSFKDIKNEKIDLKDIPPPEDISEDIKIKFKLLIDLFGENIFKNIFSSHIEHKIIGFQELNGLVTKKIIEIEGSTQDTNKYIVSLINIFFIFLDDRRPSLVSESLELFINVLKGIKERSNSNKTEYDFKITKRLLNQIRNKLNHINRQVRTKAEELYCYMLISNFCEYNSLITELVESDVDNFYKKIGITDKANLNLGKCLNNIISKGGMSNIKIDATKELIITKMNIFLKIFSEIEKNKENKTLNEKNFPKEIVGEFIIINTDHPKEEVRKVTKNVLCKYIHIFGKDIIYKLKFFVGSKELNKLFQDNGELLKIFSDIEEEEKKIEQEKKATMYKYIERKLIFNNRNYLNDINMNLNKKNKLLNSLRGKTENLNNNNFSNINNNNTINNKKGKPLIKSSSQPEYKISNKIKLEPININNKNKVEGVIKKNNNKKRKIKIKKLSNDKIDAAKNLALENTKVN